MVVRANRIGVFGLTVLLAGLVFGQAVPPKDSDSDGIPDEVEMKLGSDPNAAEKLQQVWESSQAAGAARGESYSPSRDIRKMFLGNVAGDRYLWALEFGDNYEFKNTNLLVFVDADNNPKHGQKDKVLMGTDYVLWLSDGGRGCHAYSMTGEGSTPAPTRYAMVGKRVYFCTDMPIAQEGGRSCCRAFGRCERLEPRAEVSSTGWVTVSGPPEAQRAKPGITTVGAPRLDVTDSDKDGIPDGAEERLGTDPNAPEKLDVIFDLAKASDAEARKKKLAAAPERTISQILFGNVAADRFLWCVEFGADYPQANSNFILYLDADNNAKTGRKDMPGVDFMLSAGEGNAGMTAFAPTGENVTGPANRIAIVGKRLYLCADLPLHQEKGRSVYRAMGLSETRNPAKGMDSTGWFPASGAGVSDRRKSLGLDDVAKNEGVGVTRGLDLFRALKADPANLVVKIGNCAFEGFDDDLRTEYKEPSAVRTAPGGRILATVPKDGRYHPGFLLYDQAGVEKVELRRGDKRIGVAVADEDDRRTKLFFTTQPLDWKAGEQVELRTAMSGGSYRIEDILFLAKAPEIRPRVFEISDLDVTPVWEGDGVRPDVARVTWITTWPAKCTVKCGDQQVTEEEEFANHRVYVKGLKAGANHSLTVTAPKPAGVGGEVVSDPVVFNASLPVVKASVERARTPLRVQNPSGDALAGWPVTSGVPFAQGALDSVGHIRLLGADGAERAVQTASLSRWPDGSVKWALLSFRADAPKAGATTYQMEYGRAVKPATVKGPMRVEEAPDRVAIVTGPLRVEISKAAPALPGKVWLDRNGDGKFVDEEIVCGGARRGEVRLTDEAGKEFSTLGPAEDLVVEERGPERACVLLRGHHAAKDGAKLFTYETRIMAYAWGRFVRVFYTFGNDVLTQEFTSVRSLQLVTPLEGGAARFEMGAESPLDGEAKASPVLMQDLDDHYRLAIGDKRAEGKKAPGWARVSGPRGTMTVAVRDFWRLYPKALAASPDGVAVGLMPGLAESQYAEQAKDPEQLVHLFYYLTGGRYKIKQGQTKTHELMVSFDADSSRVCLDAFQQGVAAVAPSSWVCGSLALGEIAPTGTAWASVYDAQADRAVANYLKARDSRRDYGMMNYGDWWGERRYNWANIEYDDAHVWLVLFARTGDMRAFTAGDRAAKHYADVDCIHYHADPRRVGAGYSHCIGHVGGFFNAHPVEGGTLNGGHSPCHTRTEGLVEHYLLTGDRRSFDAALGIADRFDSWWMNNYDFDNCRVPGWHIVLTTALYNATADPFYLNAAKIIARRAIERESPGGGWRRNLVPGHCFCLPRHRGNAGFMVGVLLAGLKYYHEATGDTRAAEALVRGARYLVRETYDPVLNQFRYTTCPNSPKPSSTGNMACEGFAYAARLTGAPDLVKIARDVTSDVIAHGAGGSASVIRFAPRAIWDLDRMGASQYGMAKDVGFEVLAWNPRGEDFTVEAGPAGAKLKVEVTGPSGKPVAPAAPAPDGALPLGFGPTAQRFAASGEKGIYRIRVTGGNRVITSLEGEALPVGQGVSMRSEGRLKLEFAAPPSPSQGQMAVLLKGGGKGTYTATLCGAEANGSATWQGETAKDWARLSVPAPQSTIAKGEPVSCMVQIKGPAGDLEVRVEGMPPYVSAPSGKFFCPAKPTASIRASNTLLPGSKPEVVFDASGSTDVDKDIVEYVWKFGDGTEAKGCRVTKDIPKGASAAGQGELQATLEVRDKWGFCDSCEQTITPAPAWLLELDPKAIALVEAENFSGQGGGAVQLYERVGTSGRMITYWHENVGHWLEWKVNVPKAGEYMIILKYATVCDDTHRDLKVDGAYPGGVFKDFHLPNTGGFCTSKDDWAYYTVGGEKTPALVSLSAGPHTIRMTNLRDGCALDFILLAPK